MRTLKGPLAVTLLGLMLVACGDAVGPSTDTNAAMPAGAMSREGGNPSLIAVQPGTPALVSTHASFWAVQGRRSGVVIRYSTSGRGQGGEPFLTFTVPKQAQLVDPSGHALAPGDSILIDVQVVPGQLEAQFSPHGLVFAGTTPARLSFSYRYGVLPVRAGQLAIWYVPDDGGAWEQQRSRIDGKHMRVMGEISHFSSYAVAPRSNYAVAY